MVIGLERHRLARVELVGDLDAVALDIIPARTIVHAEDTASVEHGVHHVRLHT